MAGGNPARTTRKVAYRGPYGPTKKFRAPQKKVGAHRYGRVWGPQNSVSVVYIVSLIAMVSLAKFTLTSLHFRFSSYVPVTMDEQSSSVPETVQREQAQKEAASEALARSLTKIEETAAATAPQNSVQNRLAWIERTKALEEERTLGSQQPANTAVSTKLKTASGYAKRKIDCVFKGMCDPARLWKCVVACLR